MNAELLRFLLKEAPNLFYAIGFLTVVVVFACGKQIWDIIAGKRTSPMRRWEDKMLTRYLEAFEKSAEAQTRIAESLETTSQKLNSVSENLKALNQKLEDLATEFRRAIRDIHARIDVLYGNKGTGG